MLNAVLDGFWTACQAARQPAGAAPCGTSYFVRPHIGLGVVFGVNLCGFLALLPSRDR